MAQKVGRRIEVGFQSELVIRVLFSVSKLQRGYKHQQNMQIAQLVQNALRQIHELSIFYVSF
jgi:hypothetical protein